MKRRNAMIAGIALLVTGATACSWFEREVMVPPECEPAPKPALPDLSRGETWDLLRAGAALEAARPDDEAGDLREWLRSDERPPRIEAADQRGREVYRRLELVEIRLTAWGQENADVIRAVCQRP